MYQQVALSQVFDDHDFGSNNADSRARSNASANKAYNVMVRAVNENIGIYHSYEVPTPNGKLKFIVLDTRSFKN